MTVYLTQWQVIELHDQLIRCPVRDMNALGSAVNRPQTAYGGTELYPTIAAKAAALLHGLAMNHPFVDGNKRTAWFATQTFLRLNASPLMDLNQMYAADFVTALTAEHKDVATIAQWLTTHME